MPQDYLGIFLVWQPSRGLCHGLDRACLLCSQPVAVNTRLCRPRGVPMVTGALVVAPLAICTDCPGPVLPGCSSSVIGTTANRPFLCPL